jgi:hypothetical protein
MTQISRTIGMIWILAAWSSAALADYRVAPDFPQLPKGVRLAGVSGVAIDSKGDVFIFHRGVGDADPILVFEPSGKFLRSFGKGLFKSAHGLRIDAQDNLWTTDNADHIVIKMDHDGRVLMTLGERGVSGEDASHFNKPTDVAIADNGDFFVSDGYGNSRVVKFDKDGKFLLAWGKKGKAPGEFNLPHAVRIDSREWSTSPTAKTTAFRSSTSKASSCVSSAASRPSAYSSQCRTTYTSPTAAPTACCA